MDGNSWGIPPFSGVFLVLNSSCRVSADDSCHCWVLTLGLSMYTDMAEFRAYNSGGREEATVTFWRAPERRARTSCVISLGLVVVSGAPNIFFKIILSRTLCGT